MLNYEGFKIETLSLTYYYLLLLLLTFIHYYYYYRLLYIYYLTIREKNTGYRANYFEIDDYYLRLVNPKTSLLCVICKKIEFIYLITINLYLFN